MQLVRCFRGRCVDDLRRCRRRWPASSACLLLLQRGEGSAPRCLATSGAPHAPAPPPQNLLDALSKCPSIAVAKFPGAGRGLVAASNIKYGDTVLLERPLLCYPASSLSDQVCYGCLSVLGTHNLHLTSPLSGRHFCSEACMSSCEARFHAFESLALQPSSAPGGSAAHPAQHPDSPAAHPDPGTGSSYSPLAAFEARCDVFGERFPLMAARLAFTRLTRAVTLAAPSHPAPAPPGLGSPGPTASGPAMVAGDPTSDFSFLCFANVPEPYPEPWVQLYMQLRRALEAAAGAAERQLPPAGGGQAAAAALRAELEQLSLAWFVSVLARLHINVFRVGCICLPDRDRPGATASGSAAYLVASLFNHSCEPNIEVVWRRNDSTAAFVAARDIDEGEQLFVSYMDEGLPLKTRQEHLMFGYGFKCRCQRCVEEEEDGGG